MRVRNTVNTPDCGFVSKNKEAQTFLGLLMLATLAYFAPHFHNPDSVNDSGLKQSAIIYYGIC